MTASVKVSGSYLIGKALQAEGVRNIFTLAGDHVLPALDVLSDMDFRFVDTRHEQAAVHMADAWGRITGQPGVAMYTTPGFRQRHTRTRQRNALRESRDFYRRFRGPYGAWSRSYAGDRPDWDGCSRYQLRGRGWSPTHAVYPRASPRRSGQHSAGGGARSI